MNSRFLSSRERKTWPPCDLCSKRNPFVEVDIKARVPGLLMCEPCMLELKSTLAVIGPNVNFPGERG